MHKNWDKGRIFLDGGLSTYTLRVPVNRGLMALLRGSLLQEELQSHVMYSSRLSTSRKPRNGEANRV